MTRSMTAYGRAQSTNAGKEITVELKSVNSRYFDCGIKISKLYGFLEERIKSYIQSRGIVRGKVDVYINIDVVDSVGAEISLDDAYLKSYLAALYRLKNEYGLRDDITVTNVAANRDIFNIKKPNEDLERDWLELKSVLDTALDAFIEMREREGNNLKQDILLKREKLLRLTEKILGLAEQSTTVYRQKLESRLRTVLSEMNYEFDSQRILTECALFADRIAIDEELVRLDSHFKAVDAMLDSLEPSGRKLDFLVQEMNREINTIGSKCNDADIAALVVEAKSELEKVREQIQNIE